jgi:excisionase family DNA binding protein
MAMSNSPEPVRPAYYSIQQAAVYTSLSEDHVRRAVVGGTLPAANLGTAGRPLYRIAVKDIDRWWEERKSGPKPPPRRGQSLPPSRHHQRPARVV